MDAVEGGVVDAGTIGDAALGLRVLQGEGEGLDPTSRDFLIQRYRVPQPRNVLAIAIRDHSSAAMDVSDGLAGDLTKLCAASNVSAWVGLADVPLSAAAHTLIAKGSSSVEAAVAGGDDYEVVCTIPENRWDSFLAAAQQASVQITAIGRIEAGSAVPRFLDGAGQPVALKRLSYSHF